MTSAIYLSIYLCLSIYLFFYLSVYLLVCITSNMNWKLIPFYLCSFCLSQVGMKDNPAVDPIIHGLRGVVHHG